MLAVRIAFGRGSSVAVVVSRCREFRRPLGSLAGVSLGRGSSLVTQSTLADIQCVSLARDSSSAMLCSAISGFQASVPDADR